MSYSFLQFLFIIIFLILAVFMSPSALGNVVFVINCARSLWIATSGDISSLPGWTQEVLSFLSLFAADLNFSQPGCSGISTYADLYGVNLGGM